MKYRVNFHFIKQLIIYGTYLILITLSAGAKPRIVLIKDFLSDISLQNAVWRDTGLQAFEFSSRQAGTERAGTGFINHCADIHTNPSKDLHSSIYGSYIINLPDLKRIQLELRYDLFKNANGVFKHSDFYVKVIEKNELGKYHATAIFHDPNLEQQTQIDSIKKEEDREFTSHPFIVDLSPWRGEKLIRIDLVVDTPSGITVPCHGRWVEASLKGTTFNIALGEVQKITGKQASRNSNNSLSINPQLLRDSETGERQDISINDLSNYPDTGITTVNLNGRWLAYTHAINSYNNSNKRGTVVFDLSSYSSENLYTISVDDFAKTLVRGESLHSAEPALSGNPFLLFEPSDYSSRIDNYYTGVSSAVVNNSQVHAFLNLHDRYLNLSYHNWDYTRIGYARSQDTWDHDGYEFGEIYSIIEGYQSESSINATRNTYGVGTPSVIQKGNYYYLFYTRWLDRKFISDSLDSICVARAYKNDLFNSNIEISTQAWKKYYLGSWSENGIGGKSSPILNQGWSWRAFPKVHFNTHYNEYVMLCLGPSGVYMYMTDNQDLTDWGSSVLLQGLESYPQALYPSVIGQGGSDTECDQYGMLYYAYDTNQTLGGHTMARRQIYFDGKPSPPVASIDSIRIDDESVPVDISPITLNEGRKLKIAFSGYDPGNTNPTYTHGLNPPSVPAIIETSVNSEGFITGTLTYTPGQNDADILDNGNDSTNDPFLFQFRVTNEFEESVINIVVDIINSNQPPVISTTYKIQGSYTTPIPINDGNTINAEAGQTLVFNYQAVDEDGDAIMLPEHPIISGPDDLTSSLTVTNVETNSIDWLLVIEIPSEINLLGEEITIEQYVEDEHNVLRKVTYYIYVKPLPPTPTFTFTPTYEPPTFTPTATSIPTPEPPTFTPTATSIPTPEPPTFTPTATSTPTLEPPTFTPTATSTPTLEPPTFTPTATSTPTLKPPTFTPTATSTPTPEPPTPTPEVTSSEPGVYITTKEILRRCSGKSVFFQVIVEGLNGFNDKVYLQLKKLPAGFDARIFPDTLIPPSRATLILTPKSDAGIFDNADGYGVEEFVIQALPSKIKSVEETAYINILPRGAMILKDPVPREPYQIDLRSTSKGEETVGQTVKIKGQIYNNPAIRYITVSALRPGEFAPEIHPNVEVSERGGYFDTEFEIRHSDQLVLDSNDAPWKIEAFYKSGTRDNPFNAVSEPLYLRVGESNPIAGKRSRRQLNMIASTDDDQLKILHGKVIIVGGASDGSISVNAIYNLTSTLYRNLINERRFNPDSIHYLAPVPVDPSIGQKTSNQALSTAIDNANDADYLLIYLVGGGGDGYFYLSSQERLTGDSLKSLLYERIQNTEKYTLIVVDAPQAGIMKSIFPIQPNLEVIASTGSSEDSIAIFSVSDEGQPFSFSDLFFDGLMRGKTIRDSLAYSRKHLRRIQEPNIQQIPVPLENDLSEPFASLVLGTAYTPENEPMADNLPPRIEEVPDSMKILRGGTLHLKVKIRDEEEEDKDSSGEDVILSVRITEFGTSISYEIPATYLPDSDELDIHVENFPIEPFGENAPNGQYTLSMLVQDKTDNSTAPAITSIDVIAPMQTYEFGESSLAESGWAEIAGGFSGAIPGRISMQGFNNPSIIPSSQDQKGMAIQVEPGQVAFVYATTPIQTNGNPILLRAMMRSTSQNAAIWCVGLKGDLSKTEQVDGSLTLTNAMTASAFLAQEKHNILLYNPIGEEPVTPVIQVQGNGDSATTVWIDRVEIYEIDPTKSYPSELFTMIETQPNSQTAQTSFQPDAVYEFDGASQWLEIPGGFEGANPGSIDLVDFGNNYNILPSSLDRKGLAVSMDKDELALIFSALPIPVENEPVLMRMKVQASSSNVSNWLIGLKGNVATGENVDGSKGYNYLSQSYDYSNSEKTIILLYEPDSGTLITPGIQATNKSGNGQAILYIDRMEIYKLKSGLYYPGSLFNGE